MAAMECGGQARVGGEGVYGGLRGLRSVSISFIGFGVDMGFRVLFCRFHGWGRA